ncbi:hypothetical protein EDB19DRAFT_1833364 [Suillus lakei]|nr:hypothetical protein EDB19DRAFT_1833364 [Suillus lakei]
MSFWDHASLTALSSICCETLAACLAQDVGFGNILQSKIKSFDGQSLSLLISLNLAFDLHSLNLHYPSKMVEMDNIGLNDQDNMLVYQDNSNNDMDIFRLDEDDVMNIDQGDSNNDMDVFSIDEDDEIMA